MIQDMETEYQDPTSNCKPRYHINLDWHQRNGRSFRVLMESRLCPSCRDLLGTEVEDRVATVKRKGEVVHEVRTVPFPANPIAQVRDCCSKYKEYIRPNMPLREAIFRVVLASGNQPLNTEEISQQLEWMGYGERARYISPVAIKRMLECDLFYGFVIAPLLEEMQTEAT